MSEIIENNENKEIKEMNDNNEIKESIEKYEVHEIKEESEIKEKKETNEVKEIQSSTKEIKEINNFPNKSRPVQKNKNLSQRREVMEKYSSSIIEQNKSKIPSKILTTERKTYTNFFPKPDTDFYCDTYNINHFDNEKKRLAVFNMVFKVNKRKNTEAFNSKQTIYKVFYFLMISLIYL